MVKQIKYGLQVYTVRDAIESDFDATFKTIKNIGYDYIELHSLFNKTAHELKTYFLGLGLHVASVMFPVLKLKNELAELVKVCKTLDCKYIVCPSIPAEGRTLDGYMEYAEVLERVALELEKANIKLAYHNHAFEFDKLPDGQCGYDILVGKTKHLCFEPDVFWFAFAGRNPLEMMSTLKDRMPLLHLKDMSKDATRNFCEIGCGVLPMKNIFSLAKELNVEYAFVEQDSNWAASPMESAAVSFKNISKLN